MPNQQTNRKTTEQQRAASAWNNIEEVDGGQGDKKEYGSLARGLPAMIQTNGLGQTLAFLKAKGANKTGETGEKTHKVLYRHLANWGFERVTGNTDAKTLPGTNPSRRSKDLLEWLIHNDSAVYRRATTEALTYALWLRRFAEAKGWGEEGGGRND